MSRMGACFERLRVEGDGALIVFTVAGHPDPETGAEVLKAIADGGADIIEMGVPFSDGGCVSAGARGASRVDDLLQSDLPVRHRAVRWGERGSGSRWSDRHGSAAGGSG